jgi:hypothetical protein
VFTSPVDNLQETFGIAPIEAMAAGTPQVVADWNGYKDTTVHGVTGYRIPTYWARCDGDDATNYAIGGFGYQGFVFAQSVVLDLGEYQRALQHLIDHPEVREAMGRASRARALDVFAWTAVMRAYQELWTELEAIAQRLPASPVPRGPFVRTAICRRFASFPTALFDGDARLRISDEGRRLLAGDDPFPWHSPREATFVDAAAMLAMVERVAREPGTLDELVERLSGAPHRVPATLRVLLWGVKHGLFECSMSREPDRSAGYARRAPDHESVLANPAAAGERR